MTSPSLPDDRAVRVPDVARAGRAWLAGAWRRASGRLPASSPAGTFAHK